MKRLIEHYGLWLVFGNVLAEQLGLPIPAVPTLIVAGALAMNGVFAWWTLLLVAVVACIISDTVWYVAGRYYGRSVMRLLCRVSLSPDSCVRQTEVRFERWGPATLLVAKFIPGLSTVMPPLAGAMRLGWGTFMLFNGLGAILWAGVAIGAGMLLHTQIAELLGYLEAFGTLAVEAIAVLLALYIAFKWWERRRFFRMLRVARVTVGELRDLIDSGKEPVIVDVRSPVVRENDQRYVPGALTMNLTEVEHRLDQLPTDREIIFYCTCPNEVTAASVAKRLIELGYTRVRPLQGGLDAWVEAGYAVANRPAVVAA